MTSEHCVIRARFLYTKISFFCVFLPTSGKDSGADSDSRFLSCTDTGSRDISPGLCNGNPNPSRYPSPSPST